MSKWFFVVCSLLLSCSHLEERGHLRSILSKGVEELKYELISENYTRAYTLAIKLAKLGDKEAQFFLAKLLLNGQGVQRDTLEGLSWLNVACESRSKKCLHLQQKVAPLAKGHQTSLEQRTKKLTSLYGMDAQNIHCHSDSEAGNFQKVRRCHKVF